MNPKFKVGDVVTGKHTKYWLDGRSAYIYGGEGRKFTVTRPMVGHITSCNEIAMVYRILYDETIVCMSMYWAHRNMTGV
jgi:hypothetical protein